MPMIAFSIPIATDKTELFRNAHTRFVPARREEFEASRRRLGIAAELGFLQHTPAGDVAIVIFDVSDPTHMLAGTDRAQDIRQARRLGGCRPSDLRRWPWRLDSRLRHGRRNGLRCAIIHAVLVLTAQLGRLNVLRGARRWNVWQTARGQRSPPRFGR